MHTPGGGGGGASCTTAWTFRGFVHSAPPVTLLFFEVLLVSVLNKLKRWMQQVHLTAILLGDINCMTIMFSQFVQNVLPIGENQ